MAGKEAERYYPYSSMFYANRHSFWTAGQDSWTLPPTQDQDSFLQLLNVEPVLQGVLQRRRGYELFGPFAGSNHPAFTHSYAFRNDALGLRRVVWCSPVNGPMATDEQGNIILNPIYTPAVINAASPRMVLSRDYGYFSDGSPQDLVKWDGTTQATGVTAWGTSFPKVAAFTAGPNFAGSAGTFGTGGVGWTTPGNVAGPPDGNYATAVVPASGSTNILAGGTFGINLAGATGGIQGIQVQITGFQSSTPSPGIITGTASLVKNGNFYGASKAFNLPVGTSGAVTVGGPNDVWNGAWQNADINNTNFAVGLYFGTTSGGTETFNVDAIAVTVFTGGGPLTVSSGGAGNVVLLNGRTYFYAFQNSNTLTTSDLSTPSLSTGPTTGGSFVLSNIGVSTDPQINTVLILATADGNDETTLYLVGTIPNGTTTFTDNIPDALTATYTAGPTLLTQPLYQDTDLFGNLHGIANNIPPPAGLNFMVKHKGRLYGAVGRALYYSKNLDDVTTADGLITSKWEEAWPTINQFDISETAETIQGLLSDGETLWIATESHIRRLIGDSPSNFQIPEIQFNDVGLYTQDSWKIVFSQGQPIGCMWLTKDLKIMASDFNTYADVGRPIQDILGSLFPFGQIHASFVSKGPANYYMLYLPVNTPDQMPNTVCVYNLDSKKWFIWRPSDEISTSVFLVDASGNPRWLFASAFPSIETQSYLFEWASGTFQDRSGLTVPGSTVPVLDGEITGNINSNTAITLALTPTTTHDWAFFVSQADLGIAQSQAITMSGGPWALIDEGDDGAMFQQILNSSATLTSSAILPTATNWTALMFLLRLKPSVSPNVVQARSVFVFANPMVFGFPANTTPGNGIIVLVCGQPASAGSIGATCTDSEGNVYTQIGIAQNLTGAAGGEFAGAWYCPSIIGGTLDTITWTTSGPGITGSSIFTILEVSGLAPVTTTPPTSLAVSYPVTIQTTWLDMGDYGLRKFLNQIVPTTADNTALTVQVDAASNEQDFNSPLSVVPATVVIPASIPDDVFVPLASGPSHNRAFRLTFVSPPSTIQNVLTGFSVEAGVIHRY